MTVISARARSGCSGQASVTDGDAGVTQVRVGYCCRCGYCCSIGVSVGIMKEKDDDYCRYLYWEDGLATCEFRTGRTEPERAYRYWKECCVRFPHDKSDLDSVKPHCTYYLEAEE